MISVFKLSKLGVGNLKSILNSRKFYSNYNFLNRTKLDLNENKTFLIDKYGSFSYKNLFNLSKTLSQKLLKKLDRNENEKLQSDKIGIYCSNNYTYLVSILAIWMLNGTPYVLNKSYPTKFIEYFLNDSKCKLIINGIDSNEISTNNDFNLMLEQKNIQNLKLYEKEFITNSSFTNTSSLCSDSLIPNNFKELVEFLLINENDREAFLLYTSGTSGNPKGVVITFRNLFSSIETMIDTYKWSSENHMLNPLPLNHYSGLVYCLLTPFFIGASVDLMAKFSPDFVWSKLLDMDSKINSLIAVPTIYTQLVQAYLSSVDLKARFSKDHVRDVLKNKMKLIGSGSAPLSVKTFNDWYELTNYNMVERYGMTEIGMALSTPLIETVNFKRVGGTVGRPCGSVGVRIYDSVNDKVLIESSLTNDVHLNDSDQRDEIFGELQINGPTVFREYLNKPEQTKESFTEDGWFKTGDTAKFLKDMNVYKMIGRTSVDVIKSGGHKISALDVEKELLANDVIEDVAVMGLSDLVWGQRVFALLVIRKKKTFDKDEFIKWCKLRLPKYSVPTVIKITESIPRNQLGKVNKKELIQFYESYKF